jgi:ABC-type multidrug transport system fused ATPase/permease subunit
LAVVTWEVLFVSLTMMVLAIRLQVIGMTFFFMASPISKGDWAYNYAFQVPIDWNLFLLVMQRYYLASAKELMQINGTTKSVLANHLGESILGTVTIRAFEEEDRFFAKNLDLVDKNASPYFYNFAATEWLILRLEIMSVAVISFSAFVMAILPRGTFSAGK